MPRARLALSTESRLATGAQSSWQGGRPCWVLIQPLTSPPQQPPREGSGGQIKPSSSNAKPTRKRVSPHRLQTGKRRLRNLGTSPCGKAEGKSWIPPLLLCPPRSHLISVIPAPSALPGMSISPPGTEWDCPSQVPQHSPEPTQTCTPQWGTGSPSLPSSGAGSPGLVWVKLGEQSWLPPEQRGQLWVTDPRTAGTAAITSGLAGGAGRGAALISRPGTGRRAPGRQTQQPPPPEPEPRRHVRGRPGGGGSRGALGRGGTGGLGRPGQGDSAPGGPASPHSWVPPGTAIRGFQSLSLIGFIFAS